jgi:hypothetical protein
METGLENSVGGNDGKAARGISFVHFIKHFSLV